MKLVIATGIYPPEIGGPAGYSKRLAQALVARGHDVSVVTYGDKHTDRSLGTVTAVSRRGGAVVRYAGYAWAVWKAARKSELVFLMGPVSEGLPGTVGAIFAGKPTALKVVGDHAWEQYQQRSEGKSESSMVRKSEPELLDEFLTHRHVGKIGLFEKLERWVAGRAKAIIVPSKYLKTVVANWGMPEEKINVIYNSVEPLPKDDTPSNPPLIKGEAPTQGGEGESKSIILTAVRSVPWKGGDFLCDCLKELPLNFVLAVAGDGPYLDQWKKHAEDIGVSDRVLWLGKLARKDLADWYRKADVFALATGYEGFPHVVVEACSVGLPCIVSDKGGNPETAEMFPDLVKVVEYRNKEKWVEELGETVTEGRRKKEEPSYAKASAGEGRKFEGLPGVLGFERMVNLTEEVLKKIV